MILTRLSIYPILAFSYIQDTKRTHVQINPDNMSILKDNNVNVVEKYVKVVYETHNAVVVEGQVTTAPGTNSTNVVKDHVTVAHGTNNANIVKEFVKMFPELTTPMLSRGSSSWFQN